MKYNPFEAPLQEGVLVRRYKRFLADIELDGQTIVAHCPNSGSMMGMAEPGMRVAVRHVDDPRRKLAWTWELVHAGTWVGCNTMRPNRLVEWAIANHALPGVSGTVRREVPYGENSRVDMVVGDTYVEVKNTTLAVHHQTVDPATAGGPHTALFPDAVTARGAKHMHELRRVVEAGNPAVVVFCVNRADCDRFDVGRHIDPTYGEAFDRARDAGVRMVPLGFAPSLDGWTVRGVLPMA